MNTETTHATTPAKASTRKPASLKPRRWRRHYSGDFQYQTRGLSDEQVGFLVRFQDAQSDKGAPLPKDIASLRPILNRDVRKMRRLLSTLLAIGILIETETGLYDPRVMLEILGVDTLSDTAEYRPISVQVDDPSPSQPDTEFEDTFGELQPEVGENFPENPVISTRDLEGEQRDREESIPARKRGSLVDRSETRRYPRASDRPLADPETAPASLVIRRSGPPWPSGRMPDPSWPDQTGWAMADQHGDEVPQ